MTIARPFPRRRRTVHLPAIRRRIARSARPRRTPVVLAEATRREARTLATQALTGQVHFARRR